MKILENKSVEQFKAMHNTNSLNIVKSPKTGKLFVTHTGAPSGVADAAVSKKGIPSNPQFCLIDPEDGNSAFWCMCETPQDNVVATF